MNKLLKEFKERTIPIIKQNFERDGFLSPMCFYGLNGQVYAVLIAPEFMNSERGKQALSQKLTQLAHTKGMVFVAIAMEAYAARMDAGSPLTELVQSGNMRVSELSIREDIILLAISTPMQDELITYKVDPVNWKVLGPWIDPSGDLKGRFSNFFAFRRN